MKLFMIDLDGFKYINDYLGHQEGDRALKIFSEALSRCPKMRGTMLGRYGGDEFIIIVVNGTAGTDFVKNAIRENLDEVIRKRKLPYNIRFSLGSAVYSELDSSGADLMRRADQDLYREKAEHHIDLNVYLEEIKAVRDKL